MSVDKISSVSKREQLVVVVVDEELQLLRILEPLLHLHEELVDIEFVDLSLDLLVHVRVASKINGACDVCLDSN